MASDRELLLRVPVTLVAILLTVVACGPRKNYVPFERVPKTLVGKTVAQCQAQLENGKSHRISEQSRTVSVCEVETKSTNPDDDIFRKSEHAAEAQYKLNPQAARYNIQKNPTGNVKILLTVGVEVPDSLRDLKYDKATVYNVGDVLLVQCRSKIKTIIEHSTKERPIEFAFEMEKRNKDKSYDQILTFALQDPTAENPALHIASRPKSPPLYPITSPEVEQACAANPKSEECSPAAKLERSNDPFCRDLAQVVGQWLGLEPDPLMQTACQVPATDKAPTAQPATQQPAPAKPDNPTQKPKEPGFMHALATSKPGDDFWNTAKFTDEDLGVILSPACPKQEPKKQTDKNGTLAGN